MPVSGEDMEYLRGLKPVRTSFVRDDLKWEIGEIEKLLGVGVPSEKVYPLLRLGVWGRRRLALARLGLPEDAPVLHGPFEGMTLSNDSRNNERPVAKILGAYEHEIQPLVAEADHWSRVVNIGCAEGFYAVGFALRNPARRVFAYDIDPSARRATAETARANGVRDRVTIGNACDRDAILDHAAARGGALFWIDIEGAEEDLLASVPPAALSSSDLMVETHYVEGRYTALPVVEHFRETHRISVMRQTAMPFENIPELSPLPPLDRSLILLEHTWSTPWLWLRGLESAGADGQAG